MNSPNLSITALTSQNQYARPAIAFICDEQGQYGAIWMEKDGGLRYSNGERVYKFDMTALS